MLIRISDYQLERFFEGKDYVDFKDIIDKLYELDDEKEYYKEKYEDLKEIKENDPDEYEEYILGLK